MRAASSLASIAATLAFHAALVAAVIAGLSFRPEKSVEPRITKVELIPPAVEPAPVVPPTPQPVAPAPPQPAPPQPVTPEPPPPPKQERPQPQPKRPAPPKPAAKARPPKPAPEIKAPDVAFEARPEPSNTTAPPAAPPAPPSPPAPPAPPVKTGVSIPATYAASNRKPAYPAMSRRFEEQGTVVLRVLVKADGTAGMVEIKSSSGYPLLDDSAKNAVQGWRFNPATTDGKPVAEWYQLSIPFKLQN